MENQKQRVANVSKKSSYSQRLLYGKDQRKLLWRISLPLIFMCDPMKTLRFRSRVFLLSHLPHFSFSCCPKFSSGFSFSFTNWIKELVMSPQSSRSFQKRSHASWDRKQYSRQSSSKRWFTCHHAHFDKAYLISNETCSLSVTCKKNGVYIAT